MTKFCTTGILSKFPTAADLTIEMQACMTNSLLNTRTQIPCISYDCYREFTLKNIDKNFKAKVNSQDGSNLGHIGDVICSVTLGSCEIEHKFLVYKHLLHPVILGLDFAQDL